MNQRLSDVEVGQILAASDCGVKQSEIALRFGISRSYVSKLKNRKRRQLTIRRINRRTHRIVTFKRAL